MDPLRERRTDPRDDMEQRFRACATLEPFEVGPPPGRQHLPDRTGDRRADPWDLVECSPPPGGNHLPKIALKLTNDRSSTTVGGDAKQIRTLHAQQLCSLSQLGGDPRVGRHIARRHSAAPVFGARLFHPRPGSRFRAGTDAPSFASLAPAGDRPDLRAGLETHPDSPGFQPPQRAAQVPSRRDASSSDSAIRRRSDYRQSPAALAHAPDIRRNDLLATHRRATSAGHDPKSLSDGPSMPLGIDNLPHYIITLTRHKDRRVDPGQSEALTSTSTVCPL